MNVVSHKEKTRSCRPCVHAWIRWRISACGSGQACQIDLAQLWLKRLQLIGVTFRTRTEQERLECIQACARDMLPLLRAGRVRLPIDRTFAMTDIDAAHAYMKQDQHVGKIVLLVD